MEHLKNSTAVVSPDGLNDQGLIFTVFTSQVPDRLTKVLSLQEDGSLHKEASANILCGQAQTTVVHDLQKLQEVLDGLASSQAVSWGVTRQNLTEICTDKDIQAQQRGALSRTRANFHFSTQPGVMMLDHDGLPDGSLTRDDLRDRLLTSVPVLSDAPMLWRPSASAGCVAPDGTELSKLDRHRLYIPVSDASLIPEAGKALVDLLWAAGHGWVTVGKAGQALLRCLVDASVWQPERLDFAGPPILEDGITRPHASGVIYGKGDSLFDLRALIDAVTPTVRKAAQEARREAKAALRSECETVAKEWATARAPQLAKRRGISEVDAHDVLVRASQGLELAGDFELTCSTGQPVTVSDLLDDPERWDGSEFADPIDPDDDHRVAIAYLKSGPPVIYSHRHGGVKFRLKRQKVRIQLEKGCRAKNTDEALAALAKYGDLFDFGEKAIAYVANGKVTTVSTDWLIDKLERVIFFCRRRPIRGAGDAEPTYYDQPEDAPKYIATAIMAKHDSRGFRKLNAVCTSPILRLDGSIIDMPGYDKASRLLYETTEQVPPNVPVNPSEDEALDALAELWLPFSQFPFVDDVARSVTLAGALSAMLRPVLPTCPAFGFDAPTAGTGKTLLAKTIGALAAGIDVPVLSPARDEEECRKRLFASLRNGEKVLLWDNVREHFGNAAIDTFLTSSTFADRVLGVSETDVMPNKALFMITGNNLVLTGDTHRRVLKVRLDARIEKPYTRQFAFAPLELVVEQRQRLVVAGLTLIRAHITAGRPQSGAGCVASFEDWDRLVRQPLCWLSEVIKQSGRTDLPQVCDPIKAITSAESENPEQVKLGALLQTWFREFGSKPAKVADAIAKGSLGATELNDVMDEIAGQNGKINSRILGRWIERHAEQRKDDMRFVRAGKSHGVALWQVVHTPPPQGGWGGLGGLGVLWGLPDIIALGASELEVPPVDDEPDGDLDPDVEESFSLGSDSGPVLD